MAKAQKDKKIKISGPSIFIDGKELVGAITEFSSGVNLRQLDKDSLGDAAITANQEFARTVSRAISDARGKGTRAQKAKPATSE